MNFPKKFNQSFGFTPAERKVVLILISTFIVGMSIKIAKSAFGGPPEYDYRSMDSTFAAHSAEYNSAQSEIVDSTAKQISAGKKDLHCVVNINTATKAQLVTLPGIGEVLADRILSYRNMHGSFKTVGELKSVEGIGEKKFIKLETFVTIGNDHE
jgi:competence ComEA-like helix-hairpin-helix protein